MTALLSMPPESEVTDKCPHADIRHCPLYHASHAAEGHGCDDGKSTGWNGCGVSRALDYGKQLAELVKIAPGLVAECAFKESTDRARAQRDRNMKNLGLH